MKKKNIDKKLLKKIFWPNFIIAVLSLIIIVIARSIYNKTFFNIEVFLNADLVFLLGSIVANMLVVRLMENRKDNLFVTVLNILFSGYCAIIYGLATVGTGSAEARCALILVGAFWFAIAATMEVVAGSQISTKIYASVNLGYNKKELHEEATEGKNI